MNREADLIDRNAGMIAAMREAGMMPSGWAEAFASAPRHRFVPGQVWVPDGTVMKPLRYADEPDAWLDRVYGNYPVTTDLDSRGTPVSSTSAPSVVASMLRHLDAHPGMNVLEIGTGTGWNAALLAARLGDAHVTTVEVDPDVAARARDALTAAGYTPTIVTGDGVLGHPANAPYDRVIATVNTRTVPYQWIAQTRAGGVVLVPVGNAFDDGALIRLTVDADGTASGPVVDASVAFMFLRDETPVVPDLPAGTSGGDESTTTLHPDKVAHDDYDARYAISLHLPDVTRHFVDEDDEAFTLWLLAPGSWARVSVRRGEDRYSVLQRGPRRLWDEADAAYTWWVAAGRPTTDRFGLTVTARGQTAWLDHPDNPITRPPSRALTP